MKDDLLHRASDALREEGEISRREAAVVRARILSSLREEEKKRARKIVVLLPLAAVLIATTALAAPEGSLSRAWDRAISLVGIAPKEPIASRPLEPLLAIPAPEPSLEPAPSLAAESEPESRLDLNRQDAEYAKEGQEILGGEALDSSPTPARAPVLALSPAPTPASPRTASSAPSPPPPAQPAPSPAAHESPLHPDAAQLSLYERAHHLHFIANDYPSALAAWEAYLQSSPEGPLVIEARYNRAIALVRLSRKEEALRALEPFALGHIGSGYRQSEARALSMALQDESSIDSHNE